MFRRKKKEEETPAVGEPTAPEVATETASEAPMVSSASPAHIAETTVAGSPSASKAKASGRGNRAQKVGTVASDKMQKTVLVRVDRLVLHQKYRRYVRRTSKFMAHDELGASTGDRVRIVETRPQSARKRWRVVEILQKAAK